METPVIVALISALASAVTLGFNLDSVRRNRRIEEDMRRGKEIASVKEPLAYAAFDLQSRIYNIVEKKFFDTYRDANGEDEDGKRRRDHAVRQTAYLFAQYFYWSERFRKEIQTSDLERHQQLKEIADIDGAIRKAFRSDTRFASDGNNILMLFEGEQRSIAETMSVMENGRSECRSYNSFRSDPALEKNDCIAWLRTELADVKAERIREDKRLAHVQSLLLALARSIDGNGHRFDKSHKMLVQAIEVQYRTSAEPPIPPVRLRSLPSQAIAEIRQRARKSLAGLCAQLKGKDGGSRDAG